MNDDDTKLVKECLGGVTRAYEQIIDKYQKPIFNVAYRMICNREDAEDITQAVFVKAFEKLVTYNPRYKFFSWLYRMAINESLNFIDQKKHLQDFDEKLVSLEKTPEELYDESEIQQNIQEALMSLKLEYRIVVVLRHYQDLSYHEIAQILDVPEKTVKSRLFSARQLLRDILLKKAV